MLGSSGKATFASSSACCAIASSRPKSLKSCPAIVSTAINQPQHELVIGGCGMRLLMWDHLYLTLPWRIIRPSAWAGFRLSTSQPLSLTRPIGASEPRPFRASQLSGSEIPE